MVLSLEILSPHDVLRQLADRARRRRLDANLTQRELAERPQLSLGTLKLWTAEIGAILERQAHA